MALAVRADCCSPTWLSKLHQHQPIRDLGLVLSLASEPALKSILSECCPALADPCQIGAVSIQIGVPIAELATPLDALLHYERIGCVLLPDMGNVLPLAGQGRMYHSDLQTLLWKEDREVAIATLSQAGFPPAQIQQILHLSSQAWHKSWWQQIDEWGNPGPMFQRWLRLRHHPNGSLTLQYQDYFSEHQPSCFHSQPHQVPVLTYPTNQLSFTAVLTTLNQVRLALQTHAILMIARNLSEPEIEGFMRQNVSLLLL
jgi:hypothetical protein